MEVTGVAPAGGVDRDGSRAALLREPLFWVAVAAFSGAVLGLFGTVRQATLRDPFYDDPVAQLLAQVPGFVGEVLVMLSLLGAIYPASGRRLVFLGATTSSPKTSVTSRYPSRNRRRRTSDPELTS